MVTNGWVLYSVTTQWMATFPEINEDKKVMNTLIELEGVFRATSTFWCNQTARHKEKELPNPKISISLTELGLKNGH